MSAAAFLGPALIAVAAAGAEPQSATSLPPGVRGLATRAPAGMKIDGDLAEFREAFVTPVEYHHQDLKNRAAQFFYLWDDEAFYAGLRTLDAKGANHAPDDRLWEGDAVEWYFDTRRDESFRGQAWGPGAVHCYWTAYKGDQIEPRFCLRPGYLDAIPKTGVQVAARKTAAGVEVEFKLPWVNFPAFKPGAGQVIAIDAELCYADGGPRVFRTFAYGSPLSVQQPASLASVALVERLLPEHWAACGPVLFPIRCDTAWTQEGKPQVTAHMALPPGRAAEIGKVLFRLLGVDAKPIAEFEARSETFDEAGDFRRATARWGIDVAAPGAYHVIGMVFDREGKELARVAPRLVSVNMEPGY
jgi:hypothetical protein